MKKAITDTDKIVIFNTSPSVRVALGGEFGIDDGSFVQVKMVAVHLGLSMQKLIIQT